MAGAEDETEPPGNGTGSGKESARAHRRAVRSFQQVADNDYGEEIMNNRTKIALSSWVALSFLAARWLSAEPARPLLTGTRSLRPLGENSYSFPNTPVGQTSTLCFSVCFTESSTCDGSSGTAYMDESPSQPFFFTGTAYLNVLGDQCDAANGVPVSFPVDIPPGDLLSFDVAFSPPSANTFHTTMEVGSIAEPAIYDLSGTGTGGTGCVGSSTLLCINNRFAITAQYSTVEGGGLSGSGQAIPFSSLGLDDGGSFWFFDSTNPEILVKIINGCASGGHYWVFFAATTNVGFSLTVIDTATSSQRTYSNPDLTAAQPVQDTSAFSTCP